MSNSIHSRIQWYIEHRVKHLRIRYESIRVKLNDVDDTMEPDFDMWRELVEVAGRIRELEHLLSVLDTM